MRKRGWWFAAFFPAFFMAGCATTTVSSDYNRAVDFSKFKTYAWVGAPESSGDLRFDTPDLREAIRRSIEAELTSKGLENTAAGHPDVLLKYYITVEQKKEEVGGGYPPVFSSRGAYAGVAGPTPSMVRNAATFHYEEGTFVLDMVSPGSGEILWRGTLAGMLDPGATPAKRIERVPGEVAKILKKFPPRA